MQNNKKIYLLDLDNCLYKADDEYDLVNTLENRITQWISNKFACKFEEAEEKKLKLYNQFGGAPKCFIKASYIKTEQELIETIDFIHNFKVYNVEKNLGLREKLSSLNRVLYLFTSSHINYARQILIALGVLDLFQDIIDISKVGYHFKDEPAIYRNVFRLLSTSPDNISIVDDSLENLMVANRMGINGCIWVNYGDKRQIPNYVRAIYSIMKLQ